MYLGIPLAGKTWLAFLHLNGFVLRDRAPSLIIDPERVSNFDRVPHARNLRDAIERVWGRKENTAYTPNSQSEFDALCNAIIAAKMRMHLLVDEATNFISAKRADDDDPFVRVMRSWRHIGCTVQMTGHHMTGDVPSVMFSCAPKIYIFRSTAKPVLERIAWYGIDPEKVRNLGQLEFIELFEGFRLTASKNAS